jgi:hypothetical protein
MELTSFLYDSLIDSAKRSYSRDRHITLASFLEPVHLMIDITCPAFAVGNDHLSVGVGELLCQRMDFPHRETASVARLRDDGRCRYR